MSCRYEAYNSMMQSVHIYGDNIVECERTFALVLLALRPLYPEKTGPSGCVCSPEFTVSIPAQDSSVKVTFFPGYGRWNNDILRTVRARGGTIREAPDSILTQGTQIPEEPFLALEYCGALPAGNQAWQRNGRAYSLAAAHIPYIYITEMGGFELSSDRTLRAARMPNPAVPFSYLTLSHYMHTVALPAYVLSPAANSVAISTFQGVLGEADLLVLMRNLLLGEDCAPAVESLETKVLRLVNLLAGARGRRDSLRPESWTRALAEVKAGRSLAEFLVTEEPMAWSKTAYIVSLTPSARMLMNMAKKYAVGLTSSSLPLCLVSSSRRAQFATEVSAQYPLMDDSCRAWLSREKTLAIAWIMGFKPRGDDARPDRGLAPLARMLVGPETDILSIVYGPAPADTWNKLDRDPVALGNSNGLWEATMAVSDAILVDSRTADNLPTPMYLAEHWQRVAAPPATLPHTSTLRTPTRFGEQDVDTAIHVALSSLSGESIFECMCNPPGGDWSGLTTLTPDREFMIRWLSLPRVSSANAKRPDHVFEMFDISDKPIVLAIESKGRASDLEPEIGSRLVRFVQTLMNIHASVEKKPDSSSWIRSNINLRDSDVYFASAAAIACRDSSELLPVARSAGVDIVLGLRFQPENPHTHFCLLGCTPIGLQIRDSLRTIDLGRVDADWEVVTRS